MQQATLAAVQKELQVREERRMMLRREEDEENEERYWREQEDEIERMEQDELDKEELLVVFSLTNNPCLFPMCSPSLVLAHLVCLLSPPLSCLSQLHW